MFGGTWFGRWLGQWFGTSDDQTLAGTAVIVSSSWTANLDFVARSIEHSRAQAGQQITSRNSDPRAYELDRVADRLRKVVIAGREYDPFDPTLLDRLEDILHQEPSAAASKAVLREDQLAKFFEVKEGPQSIRVPLSRPALRVMPALDTSTMEELSQHAAQARELAAQQRRRILLLLSASH